MRVTEPSTIPTVEDTPGTGSGGPRIRCPKCKWSPGPDHLWRCRCGFTWNTFDTGGVCPGCLYQWKDTQCPQCKQWSAHSDWYTQ